MSTTQEKDYNYGLSILRVIMTFEVILSHLMDFSNYSFPFKILQLLTTSAVPIFMMMSFYFSYKTFIETNKEKLIRRIKNLLVPYIGWAIVYWIVYTLFDFVFNTDLVYGIDDLFIQLFTGHNPRLNYALWFQIILILFIVLFYLLCKAFNNKIHLVLIVLFIVCILFQYTGINYRLFSSFNDNLATTLGRIIETLPYAIIGFLLAKYDSINYLKKHTISYLVIIIILSILLVIEYMFNKTYLENFGYQGFRLMLISLIIFIFFAGLNIRLNNKLFYTLTKHTSGVYYTHLLIGKLIEQVLLSLNIEIKYYFLECIFVYVVCYLLSCLISNNKNQLIKQLVSN